MLRRMNSLLGTTLLLTRIAPRVQDASQTGPFPPFLSGETKPAGFGEVREEKDLQYLQDAATPAMALGTTAVIGLPQQPLGHKLAHARLLPCPCR